MLNQNKTMENILCDLIRAIDDGDISFLRILQGDLKRIEDFKYKDQFMDFLEGACKLETFITREERDELESDLEEANEKLESLEGIEDERDTAKEEAQSLQNEVLSLEEQIEQLKNQVIELGGEVGDPDE